MSRASRICRLAYVIVVEVVFGTYPEEAPRSSHAEFWEAVVVQHCRLEAEVESWHFAEDYVIFIGVPHRHACVFGMHCRDMPVRRVTASLLPQLSEK